MEQPVISDKNNAAKNASNYRHNSNEHIFEESNTPYKDGEEKVICRVC